MSKDAFSICPSSIKNSVNSSKSCGSSELRLLFEVDRDVLFRDVNDG